MTPTPTTDSMRARIREIEDSRPALDDHTRQCVGQLLDNAAEQLREAFKLLRHRPDLSDPIKFAGLSAKAVKARMGLEFKH